MAKRPVDIRRLRPTQLLRLLNSTALGPVMTRDGQIAAPLLSQFKPPFSAVREPLAYRSAPSHPQPEPCPSRDRRFWRGLLAVWAAEVGSDGCHPRPDGRLPTNRKVACRSIAPWAFREQPGGSLAAHLPSRAQRVAVAAASTFG